MAILSGDVSIPCCLDTGADVTVIPQSLLECISMAGGMFHLKDKLTVTSIHFGSSEFPTVVFSQVVLDIRVVTDIGRVRLNNVECCVVPVDLKEMDSTVY